MTEIERARDIQRRALEVLSKPAALMLPKDIRNLIIDLVALVVALMEVKSDANTKPAGR